MWHRHLTLISFVANMCLQSWPVFAQEVFKWTDSEGKVHYGDRPTEQNTKQIHIEKAPPPDKAFAERLRQQEESLKESDRREAARKADKDIRNTWEGFKDALRGGPARR